MNCPIVIGLGSDHGDDQAGWLVVDDLHRRRFPNENLVRLNHPAGLLDALNWDSEVKGQKVILCDACIGKGQPGAVHRLKWTKEGLTPMLPEADEPIADQELVRTTCHPVYNRHSASHDVSIFELIELGVNLGWSPYSVEIWTVEGTVWNLDTDPSPSVVAAASHVADEIWKEIQHA